MMISVFHPFLKSNCPLRCFIGNSDKTGVSRTKSKCALKYYIEKKPKEEVPVPDKNVHIKIPTAVFLDAVEEVSTNRPVSAFL